VIDAADVADRRRHFPTAEIGAPETDTGVSESGFEGEGDFVARMETDSRAGNRSTKRPLWVHQAP
jgi:hypothetical protein